VQRMNDWCREKLANAAPCAEKIIPCNVCGFVIDGALGRGAVTGTSHSGTQRVCGQVGAEGQRVGAEGRGTEQDKRGKLQSMERLNKMS